MIKEKKKEPDQKYKRTARANYAKQNKTKSEEQHLV